jgi:hypothetical protein
MAATAMRGTPVDETRRVLREMRDAADRAIDDHVA